MSQYPEHEKLQKKQRLADVTQQLGEWLDENDAAICVVACTYCGARVGPDMPAGCRGLRGTLHDEIDTGIQYVPLPGSRNQQLATIFCVDYDALEVEKRTMLEEQRKMSRIHVVKTET